MSAIFVVLFIVLLTLSFWGLEKLFASKVSPTLVGTPTSPNAQTKSVAAANRTIVPTSEGDVILADVEKDVKAVVTDVKAVVTDVKSAL